MFRTHQPLARLVCLGMLCLGLISGRTLESERGDTMRRTASLDALTPSSAILLPSAATIVAPTSWETTSPTRGASESHALPPSNSADVSPTARLIPPAPEPATNEEDSETLYRICRVTAYCDHGITASGVPSGVGQCAAPGYIPLGSTVYIPALDRTFVVTDRTNRRFRRSTVDIFIPSKQACRHFGCQYLECEFTVTPPDQADE